MSLNVMVASARAHWQLLRAGGSCLHLLRPRSLGMRGWGEKKSPFMERRQNAEKQSHAKVQSLSEAHCCLLSPYTLPTGLSGNQSEPVLASEHDFWHC